MSMRVLGAVAILIAMGVACSSSPKTAPAASPTDRASAVRAFVQCMAQHGAPVPTPSPGQRGLGRFFSGVNRNDPKVVSAFQACRAQLGGFGRRFPQPSASPSGRSV